MAWVVLDPGSALWDELRDAQGAPLWRGVLAQRARLLQLRGADAVAGLSDGAPLLAYRLLGKGRICVSGVAWHPRWSNLMHKASFLALVQGLCRDRGTALVWITHDLAVVAGIADRVAVMYAGRIVEEGPVDAVLDAPAHPYTRALIDSVPASHPKGTRLPTIPGRMPGLTELPPGCAFSPRCPHATPACTIAAPEVSQTADGRAVRCLHPLVALAERGAA
jgi:oligopeptide/dipeptide ABC transporter ATP-binding protein